MTCNYISAFNKELRGIIKGSGYLCGCQSCNYSKVSHLWFLTLCSKILIELTDESYLFCLRR